MSKWRGSEEENQQLATRFLAGNWKWTKDDNGDPVDCYDLFKTAWVLEAVHYLAPGGTGKDDDDRLCAEAEAELAKALKDGCVQIDQYPQSAYLTQLSVRTLKARKKLNKRTRGKVMHWAWGEIHRQMALHRAKSATADCYQLAYSIILVASLGDWAKAKPDDLRIVRTGLDLVFLQQRKDGEWPRSQPLFSTNYGTAHCYEYEMLVQLLSESLLQPHVRLHLRRIRTAFEALESTGYKLGEKAYGWSSRHHASFTGPESWSTACVFHFLYVFDRLLAKEIRSGLFSEVGVPYEKPIEAKKFGDEFLDCPLFYDRSDKSLVVAIRDQFVKPIKKLVKEVELGICLPPEVGMSAIFFGPPGTSKTELGRLIANYLGWPLLRVDPSHFVKEGVDRIEARAASLFAMLAVAEGVVVLFDEFDEMVRERSGSSEFFSRFLTTAMLPKLTMINENRRIVFLVATNHIDTFDVAIRRKGRFDMIVQVMPPGLKAKFKKWRHVRERLDQAGLKPKDKTKLRKILTELTYLEMDELQKKLRLERDLEPAHVEQLIGDAGNKCILEGVYKLAGTGGNNPSDILWRDACREQRKHIRVP